MLATTTTTMRCGQVQQALSVRLDGEVPWVSEAALDAHLAGCRRCAGWLVQAQATTRLLRVRTADAVPDLSEAIMARATRSGVLAEERSARVAAGHRPALMWLRLGLAVVAGWQILVALPAMLHGDHSAAAIPGAGDFASCHLALAVGFLTAAIRPRQMSGLLVLVGALAAAMVWSTGVQVIDGHVPAASMGDHLPTLIGLTILGLTVRISTRGGSGFGSRSAPPWLGGGLAT